jgi:hypothetical protein
MWARRLCLCVLALTYVHTNTSRRANMDHVQYAIPNTRTCICIYIHTCHRDITSHSSKTSDAPYTHNLRQPALTVPLPPAPHTAKGSKNPTNENWSNSSLPRAPLRRPPDRFLSQLFSSYAKFLLCPGPRGRQWPRIALVAPSQGCWTWTRRC